MDFPHLPFPKTAKHFETLSELGWSLVEAHLQRKPVPGSLGAYTGRGGHVVEKVRYSEIEKSVLINKAQKFENIPQNVWEFYIGGFQALEKYLKSREGRKLSLDEIEQVGAIADIIAFTIKQMAKIDKTYRKAFPDQT